MLGLLPLLLQDPLPESGPPRAPEVLVTATVLEEDPLEVPWSVTLLGREELLEGPRTLPEALAAVPSVMVQKTAYGQSSPYIRGFTSYHNVLLVDGIRLNHTAMRSGPNQYWSTVDGFATERLEVVRGPAGVLYGSDAVGGVVNAISAHPPGPSESPAGSLFLRGASAEHGASGRVDFSGTLDGGWGFSGGLSRKSFGDLVAGGATGLQPSTGYEEEDADLRLRRELSGGMTLDFGFQRVFQDDVPRTHKTVDGLSWNGTSPGDELFRLLDQRRQLVWGSLSWKDGGGWADDAELTLSLHRHDQDRNRMKSDGSGNPTGGDLTGFGVDDLGLSARFHSDGGWVWGMEAHDESVDSYKRKTDATGAVTSTSIQGPVADDSRVRTQALYLQREMQAGGWSVLPGIRASWTALNAGRVEDPDTGFSTSLSRDWSALTGGVRFLRPLGSDTAFFAGLSQGFRTPSLHDLTSLDETSVVETPDFDLQPEGFLQAEVGVRGWTRDWDWDVSAWHTVIQDMIVRSPVATTGSTVGKDNADGWVQGTELAFNWRWAPNWSSRFSASMMDGEVEQRLAVDSGVTPFGNLPLVDAPMDRLMPAQAYLSTRWQPGGASWWVEGRAWAMGRADKLSFRDERDTGRIPPGGTPGFLFGTLAAGIDIDDDRRLWVGLENIGNVDYRVHGSGINGPGRNLLATLEVRF